MNWPGWLLPFDSFLIVIFAFNTVIIRMRLRLALVGQTVGFLVSFFLLAGQVHSRHFPDTLINHLNGITEQIYNERFDSANALIDCLYQDSSWGPTGPLFRAILYQSQMMAAESDFLVKPFLATLDSVEASAKQMLEKGTDSALAYFYLGHNQAFRSLYKGRAGHTWAAIKHGLAAGRAYNKGYELDPSFYDLAFGLGSYRYWKSVKTKLINWTPLFRNEKTDGISLLLLAADSAQISVDAARTALIWVYINEKLFDEAIGLSESLATKYPHGLTFLWPQAETCYRLKEFSRAVSFYETIASHLRENQGNYYNGLEAAYFLSECYRALLPTDGNYHNKLAALQDEVRSWNIPAETQKRQSKKLKKILAKIQ